MNSISKAFSLAKKEGRPALLTYTVAGDNSKKNSLKISICDNGIGIPKNLIDKIFLPFYSTKKRGSGIGLFLVKRIIDDHEGTIALESKEGITTAQIILPF